MSCLEGKRCDVKDWSVRADVRVSGDEGVAHEQARGHARALSLLAKKFPQPLSPRAWNAWSSLLSSSLFLCSYVRSCADEIGERVHSFSATLHGSIHARATGGTAHIPPREKGQAMTKAKSIGRALAPSPSQPRGTPARPPRAGGSCPSSSPSTSPGTPPPDREGATGGAIDSGVYGPGLLIWKRSRQPAAGAGREEQPSQRRRRGEAPARLLVLVLLQHHRERPVDPDGAVLDAPAALFLHLLELSLADEARVADGRRVCLGEAREHLRSRPGRGRAGEGNDEGG